MFELPSQKEDSEPEIEERQIEFTGKVEKDEVSKLPGNLSNLVNVLNKAYQLVQTGAKGGDLLVCLGNTGCGKSTMLTSLIFGTDALDVKSIKKEIGHGGRKRIFTFIVSKEEREEFKIGHSQASSMTFVPHLKKEESSGITYVDLAGF